MPLNTLLLSTIIGAIVLDKFTMSTSSSTSSKGCFYNGQYRHGNWTDGCDFSCTCLNPETGHYKCTVRCPVYHAIPKGCVLSLPPGEECCKEPDCSALTTTSYNTLPSTDLNTQNTIDYSAVTDITTEIPVTNTILQLGCLYNGSYYQDSWNVGCEEICTCTDQEKGEYSCRKRCMEHLDPPSSCHLYLPPGEECCKEIKCNSSDQSKLTFDNDITTLLTRDIVANSNSTNEVPKEQHTRIKKKDIKKERSQKLSPMAFYETILNHMKGATDINSYLFEPGVQYNVDPKSIPSKGDVSLKDRDKIIESFFTRYGPVSLFGADKSQKRQRRTLTSAQNSFHEQSKHPAAELSKTLEMADYLLDHRAKQGQRLSSGDEAQYRDAHGSGFCVYKGQIYSKDDTWLDDCNNTCICHNAVTGKYKCKNNCPEYKSLPPGCTMRPSPRDKCCLVPDCHYGSVIQVNQSPFDNFLSPPEVTTMPEPLVSVHKRAPGIPPLASVSDISYTDPSMDVHLPIPDVHLPSDININSQRMQVVGTISLQNREIQMTSAEVIDSSPVPVERVLKESFNRRTRGRSSRPLDFLSPDAALHPEDWLNSGGARGTIVGKGSCIHKGMSYKQGESWNDGCKFVCTCEDIGRVSCTNRCRNYTYVPTNCQLSKPNPQECCEVLICQNNMFEPAQRIVSEINARGHPVNKKAFMTSSVIQPPSGLILGQEHIRQRSSTSFSDPIVTLEDPYQAPVDLSGVELPTRSLFVSDVTTSVRRFRINKPASNMTASTPASNLRPEIAHLNLGFDSENFDHMLPQGVEYNLVTKSTSKPPKRGSYQWHKKYRSGIPVFLGYMKKQRERKDPLGYFMSAKKLNDINEKSNGQHLSEPTIDPVPVTEVKNEISVFDMARIPGSITYKMFERLQSNTSPRSRIVRPKITRTFTRYAAPGTKRPRGSFATMELITPNPPQVDTYPKHFIEPRAADNRTGNNLESLPSGPGCLVNGKLYRQGESWKVNCRRRCSCIDEMNQGISCKPLCVRWKLPAACILELPAPGKCCHTPKCPDGYAIKYPNDFIPE